MDAMSHEDVGKLIEWWDNLPTSGDDHKDAAGLYGFLVDHGIIHRADQGHER